MIERKYYIDNLRWFCILLLIPFHAAMAWNNWEGNYIWFEGSKVLSSLVISISPWFMPLMFVLAGMSARYALNQRSYRQFALERVQKLLIPLLAGTLTVVAYMAYMADKFFHNYNGNFISHYKVFFTNLTDMTGYDGAFTPGHLWFILYLFIISMLSLLIIMIQRRVAPKFSLGEIKSYYLPFLLIFPLVMTPILNIGGKSIGQFLALYLLGYYILSEENVLKKLAGQKYMHLSIMLTCDVIVVYLFVWKGQWTGTLLTVCSIITPWFGILGLLGLAKCFFNHNNQLTQYLSKSSFLFYIFHFGWLVTFQYLLSKTLFSAPIQYSASVLLTLLFTLLTCEIVRRIPGLRWLFGIK
ncbi:MAG TPA: acyltransferase [Lachnospiraceae bacterium]|nr:acyltransferase [Lachnospiraceae bacterium]